MEYTGVGSCLIREELRVKKSYQVFYIGYKDGSLSEPARQTLVFDVVCVYRVGEAGESNRIVHQKWENSHLHFSIRVLSNDVEKALANILRDVEDTFSNLEDYLTEGMSHRSSQEQASCKDVFDENVNTHIWTMAQSLRFGFQRTGEESRSRSLNSRDLSQDMRGRDHKRYRSSSPKRLSISPPRKTLNISDIVETKGKIIQDGSDISIRCGKSRLSRSAATKICKEPYYKSDGKWWDMYMNEKCVVWDDYRYPYKVEKKGCMAKFNSEFIFITSNVNPNTVCSVISKDAFIRRLDIIINLESFDGINIKGTDKDNEIYNCTLDDFIEELNDLNNDYKN